MLVVLLSLVTSMPGPIGVNNSNNHQQEQHHHHRMIVIVIFIVIATIVAAFGPIINIINTSLIFVTSMPLASLRCGHANRLKLLTGPGHRLLPKP